MTITSLRFALDPLFSVIVTDPTADAQVMVKGLPASTFRFEFVICTAMHAWMSTRSASALAQRPRLSLIVNYSRFSLRLCPLCYEENEYTGWSAICNCSLRGIWGFEGSRSISTGILRIWLGSLMFATKYFEPLSNARWSWESGLSIHVI
jgi:hypothetical protein